MNYAWNHVLFASFCCLQIFRMVVTDMARYTIQSIVSLKLSWRLLYTLFFKISLEASIVFFPWRIKNVHLPWIIFLYNQFCKVEQCLHTRFYKRNQSIISLQCVWIFYYRMHQFRHPILIDWSILVLFTCHMTLIDTNFEKFSI